MFSLNSWSSICPEQIQKHWVKKAVDSIPNEYLFKYVTSKYGPPLRCNYNESKNDEGISTRRLELFFSKSISLVQTMRIPGSTWIGINFADNYVENKEIEDVMDETIKRQRIFIKWSHYRSHIDNDVTTRIYCDEIHGTGSVAIAKYRKNKLQEIEYGHIENYMCPTSYEEIIKLREK
ncbi:hypothetical protein DOM22_09400 [Bdellovibrio sp. ZAP7]|uniref:hypothetical protein n=1 Tax=Bdellovibrio sp. ZAP7 TaxID=2231053 RepID=UPI00115A91EA|nr:hypothetical protein [Bdellovibrio sp. ZAP7]QDK45352.1 hypothetical protein DOM22_09400 [Bdellovibrio sp. ZAP7]